MRNKSFFLIAIFLLIMFLSSYSCSFRGPVLRPEADIINYKEASLLELVAMINERAKMIDTITASINIDFRPLSVKNFRSCKGRLLLEKPDKIRLKGYRSLLPTFFLLVSNGNSYWLSIPSKKRVYLGQVDEDVKSEALSQEEMYLTPSHIIEALFLDEIELNDSRKAFLDILPKMYIMNIIEISREGDIFSKKKIWMDRKDFTIYQHQFFNPEGMLLSEVSFRDYRDVSGTKMPSLVYIKRPWERIDIRLLFNNITLNAVIDQEAFRFSPPKEQKIINVSNNEEVQKNSVLD